jgi:hypothetical protein
MYNEETFLWFMGLFDLDRKLNDDLFELPPPTRLPRKSKKSHAMVLSDYHPIKIKKE